MVKEHIIVLNSSPRKMALSGWLKKHHEKEFLSPLKFQKFLFFYETLSIVDKDHYELKRLRGYMQGPVFSDVYGDYKHEKEIFCKEAQKTYSGNKKTINNDRATLSSFLVRILTASELSDLSHEFNIWKAKENEIRPSMKNVPLSIKDFNKHDVAMLTTMKKAYPTNYIDSVEIIEESGKIFLLKKSDMTKLNENSEYAFFALSKENSLQNPVYVSVSDDGVLLVD